MQDVNVFDSPQPPNGEFFKFAQIGDAIQGTFVGKRDAIDGFGSPQTVFILKDKNGVYHNIGLNQQSVSLKIVEERMLKEGAELGHIIGFKYDAQADSKKQPGTKAKVINLYFDRKLIDQDWLASPEGIEALASTDAIRQEQYNNFEAPRDAAPVGGALPTAEGHPTHEALDAIRMLAKTKGLTNDALHQEEADRAIATYTGLPLTEGNYTATIIKLTSYVPA